MNVNLNKVKKRASLNDDCRISTENSEPFFKGSLVEICILSYAPYSFSEKHSLKHELMPFFSETRLGKIGRWLPCLKNTFPLWNNLLRQSLQSVQQ